MEAQSIFEIDSDFDRCAELLNPQVLEQIDGADVHKFRSSEPLRCLVRKKSYGDMIRTYPTHFFVSERLLRLFQDEQLTGFETMPANMKLVFEHDPADRVFHQLIVTGWGGVADPRSGIVQVPSDRSKQAYSAPTAPAFIFDESQWDGTDFFLIFPLTGSRFVTGRVVELLKKFKIKHYSAKSLANFAFSSPSAIYYPAPLRCCYTEARALELGGKLGIDWWEVKPDDA